MRSALLLLLFLACCLLGTPIASIADSVSIEYEISAMPGTVALDGNMTVVFPATDVSTLATGMGTFENFRLSGYDVTAGGLLVGGRVELLAPAPGLFNGYALRDPYQAGTGTTLASISASQGFCTSMLAYCQTFQSTQMGPFSVTEGGAGKLFSQSGYTFVTWTGQEVSRTFLPEPGSTAVLASGVVLLGVLARRRLDQQA